MKNQQAYNRRNFNIFFSHLGLLGALSSCKELKPKNASVSQINDDTPRFEIKSTDFSLQAQKQLPKLFKEVSGMIPDFVLDSIDTSAIVDLTSKNFNEIFNSIKPIADRLNKYNIQKVSLKDAIQFITGINPKLKNPIEELDIKEDEFDEEVVKMEEMISESLSTQNKSSLKAKVEDIINSFSRTIKNAYNWLDDSKHQVWRGILLLLLAIVAVLIGLALIKGFVVASGVVLAVEVTIGKVFLVGAHGLAFTGLIMIISGIYSFFKYVFETVTG